MIKIKSGTWPFWKVFKFWLCTFLQTRDYPESLCFTFQFHAVTVLSAIKAAYMLFQLQHRNVPVWHCHTVGHTLSKANKLEHIMLQMFYYFLFSMANLQKDNNWSLKTFYLSPCGLNCNIHNKNKYICQGYLKTWLLSQKPLHLLFSHFVQGCFRVTYAKSKSEASNCYL